MVGTVDGEASFSMRPSFQLHVVYSAAEKHTLKNTLQLDRVIFLDFSTIVLNGVSFTPGQKVRRNPVCGIMQASSLCIRVLQPSFFFEYGVYPAKDELVIASSDIHLSGVLSSLFVLS